MITSSSNDLLKSIRKLRGRKYRDETSQAYIEGTRIVWEAIEQHAEIEKIILSQTFENSPKRSKLYELVQKSKIEQIIVSDEAFVSISSKQGPQGIGAVIRQNWTKFEDFQKDFYGLWFCLWEVADPGNLGTILRTMDAVGARGLILLGNSTDPYDPGAVRSSMGALFSKILVKSDLDFVIRWIKENNITTFGTSDAARTYYRDVDYPDNMVLVMGSEREGIPEKLQEVCTKMVYMPMMGSADSLNLAVASGVILYEILDQRLRRTRPV